jgi:hypothetical protein
MENVVKYSVTNLCRQQLTNLLVLFLAVEPQKFSQLDSGGRTGADLQMKCTLHPSQLSLALQFVLHYTEIRNKDTQEFHIVTEL